MKLLALRTASTAIFAGTLVIAASRASLAQTTGPITTGLGLWLEANQGVTTDGSGNVTGWLDQSGNGNNAVVPTGAGEAVLAQNAQNGLPVVQFDGATDTLEIPSQVITSQQFTVLTVVTDNRATTDSNFREIFSNWSGTTFEQSIFLGTTNITGNAIRFTDAIGGATDPINTDVGVGSAPIGQAASFGGVSDVNDADVYYGNGGLVYDNGSAIPMRNEIAPYWIGSQGGSVEYWQGNIDEVLVYNGALTSTQIAQDFSYLDVKWGLVAVPGPSALCVALLGLAPALPLIRRRSRRRRSPNVR